MKKLIALSTSLFILTGCVAAEPNLQEGADYDENVIIDAPIVEESASTDISEEVSDVGGQTQEEEVSTSSEPKEDDRGAEISVVERNSSAVEEGPEEGRLEVVDAPTNYQLSYETIEDDQCKLVERSYRGSGDARGTAASFPKTPVKFPRTGNVNIDLIFLEWEDEPKKSSDTRFHRNQARMFADWVEMVSEGKINVNLKEHGWFTVPGSASDFYIPSEWSGGAIIDEVANAGKNCAIEQCDDILQPILDHWTSAVDPYIDFSSSNMVLFGIPVGSNILEDGMYGTGHSPGMDRGGVVRTEERHIYDWSAPGNWFMEQTGSPPWVFYAHEWGHSVGLSDFRIVENQFLPKDEFEFYKVNPMGTYELMDNQGGPTRTITSWLRWVQGWLDDDQVTCVLPEQIGTNYYELNPLNVVGADNKSIVIKMSDTDAIVVESRRWDPKFDVQVVNNHDGLIVYTVDATLGHNEGPLRLQSPRDITKYLRNPYTSPDWRVLDAVLDQGDFVEVDGIRIELVDKGSGKDIVKVSR